MSFDDLPHNLRDLPLTDPALQADLVDLVVSMEDRHTGVIALVLCDREDRPLLPIVIGGDADPSQAALAQLFELVLPMVGDDGGSVLVARGRSRSLVPTDTDRAWHQSAIDACARHGARLLGFFLATPAGVDTLPPPLSLAS